MFLETLLTISEAVPNMHDWLNSIATLAIWAFRASKHLGFHSFKKFGPIRNLVSSNVQFEKTANTIAQFQWAPKRSSLSPSAESALQRPSVWFVHIQSKPLSFNSHTQSDICASEDWEN